MNLVRPLYRPNFTNGVIEIEKAYFEVSLKLPIFFFRLKVGTEVLVFNRLQFKEIRENMLFVNGNEAAYNGKEILILKGFKSINLIFKILL